MKFKQQLVPSNIAKTRSYAGTNAREFITVHQTGNLKRGAGAQAHANLQSRGNPREASWHESIDDTWCIQSFPHTTKCWHTGRRSDVGNNRSIAIELCINSDSDYDKTIDNGAMRVAQLMREYNIPIENVVEHNRWSNKDCPRQIRAGKNGIRWHHFIQKVLGYFSENTEIPTHNPDREIVFASPDHLIDALAREVIAGKWGNNPQRKRDLTKAGHNYAKVQARVNQILSGKSSTKQSTKSIDVLAREVIAGKWGNNPQRKRDLTSAGHDYAKIQARVNQLLKGK